MIIDLFAGPGGWSTGLNMLGRSEDAGFEWDKHACDTARAAGHSRVQADIARRYPSFFRRHVEGVIGSPPCQGFSTAGGGAGAGGGRGRHDSALLIAALPEFLDGDPRARLHEEMHDDRSVLALEPLRWVLALEPEWTAWEQVPGVLPLWEACAEILRAVGYEAEASIVQAESLGVPQSRKRAILRAQRGRLAPLVRTHSKFNPANPHKLEPGMPKWVSMAEALEQAGMPVPGVGWEQRMGRFANSASRGVEYPAPTMAFGHDAAQKRWVYRGSNQANAAKRPLDHPAPTVNFSQRSNKVEWMPSDTAADPKESGVRVSVQEAAVFQSFPVDYPWSGPTSHQYRQIGDAVPPLMAARILESLGAGSS